MQALKIFAKLIIRGGQLMRELSPAVKQIVLEKGINLMVQTGAITIPGISPKQEVKVEWKRKKTRK